MPPLPRSVYGLVAANALLHLAIITRYGLHGDELYFIECGRHLAWGYVDHAPLVPWLARAAESIGGVSPVALRIPSILAGAGTLLMTALMVREWRGGVLAQWLAGLALVFAPALLRMGSMLDLPVLDVFFWTAASYLVARILARGEQRLWLAVGAVAGIGLLNKHSMLLWGAGLAAGIVLTRFRSELRSRWLWLGLALAMTLISPNLWWQAHHDWATVVFLRNMSSQLAREVTPLLFVLGQLLYLGPLAAPLWIAGLVGSFRTMGGARVFGISFLAIFVVLQLTHGKPYYMAGAYPAMFAAGGVVLERALSERRKLLIGYAGVLGISGAALSLLVLPILPVKQIDAGIGALFGWVVKPMALTHDLHAEYGWEQHAAGFTRVFDALPPEQKARVALLAGSYSQAAAVNVLGPERLPRAVSGHMTYALWPPPPQRGAVLIASGVRRATLDQAYGQCVVADRIVAPEARPWDANQAVYLCSEPKRPFSEWWPTLARYGNTVQPVRR